ncbi:hypothetical protein [uncultured Chryseobacterium sp.]|uniref:hypothetical protein n=1 Tax=uncultured Chryseobacterium sp. TaxID=259322 RepID=UPI0025F16D7F|nr:hypothetical protein [uncultured Chryseobacterium sp.]
MNIAKFIFLSSCLLTHSIFSQTTGSRTITLTLPVVTQMDVEPAGSIILNFTAPTEAGNPVIVPLVNTTKWINYTSAIALSGATRRIAASISQIIPGTDIRIQAAAASGSGGGALGLPSGQVVLTTTGQTIISGIGGAFTGNGTNNGHQLTISLTINSYADLTSRSNTPIVITYTITE